MKKLSKKLLSVLLVIAMLVPTGSLMVQTSAVSSYITALATSHRQYNNRETQQEDEMITKAYLHDAQYNVIDYDLNKGVEYSDWIYAGYKTGTNASDAIRGLKVYKGSSAPSLINSIINGVSCTFYPVSDIAGGVCNLNSNAKRGTSIFLYYTKDVAAGNPINSISVSSSIGSNCVTYFDSSSAAELNVGAGGDYIFINYTAISAGSSSDVPTGPQIPAGYDFKEDSYNFCNYSANIAKKYYRTMYEPSVASVVYEKTHKTEGLCFGFAYTTAAIYNGLPQVERWEWSKLFGTENAQSIRDIVNQKDSYGVRVSSSVRMFNDDILLNDSYIKYAYIFQFSSEAAEIYNSTKNDIAGLVNTVKSFLSANQVGVAVGFVKSEKAGGGGHEVLAVGMDGKDILIDDPNNIDDYERIIIKDDGSWEFTGYGGYTSDNSTIDYSTNTYRPYQILLTGEKIDAPVSDQNKNECFVEGVEKIDSENMLLIVDSKNYSINNSDYVQGVTAKSGAEELNNSTNMYWIKNIDTAEVFVTDDEGTITVAGDNSILTATVTEESTVSMTINESYINASVMTNTGEKSELTFETVDDEGTVTGITVSGTANSDEVTATETEDGIQVTGLNNITVTYETVDGTAETTAKVDDGSTVNITVNDDNNTVETDWQCKHPDENHDGICDSCAEDFTKSCSCSCHSNAFMQFLHKILCFLYRIFGMEQYRYCGCGKAHW